jgi:uncharacterized protein (TIGR00251 family)
MPSARLNVYIQPRASKTEIAGTHDGMIKIRISAPAVENAANRALIEFIAQRLGIAKRSVRIVSGSANRKKVLEIDGVGADAVAELLKRDVAGEFDVYLEVRDLKRHFGRK